MFNPSHHHLGQSSSRGLMRRVGVSFDEQYLFVPIPAQKQALVVVSTDKADIQLPDVKSAKMS